MDHEHVKVGQAGADFGAQPASPGPKANLASPTTVGECASQEPPWRQVGMWYLALVASHLQRRVLMGGWYRHSIRSYRPPCDERTVTATFLLEFVLYGVCVCVFRESYCTI